MKKVLIAASMLVVLGLLSGNVFADSIDFNGASAGNSGTWSWASNTLSATYNSTSNTAANIPGGSPSTGVGTISFTSGTFTGSGSGTLADPYTFGSGGSLSVDNAAGGVCTGGNTTGCFSGAFVGAQVVSNGIGSFNFTANLIDGTVDTGLLTALGFPTNITAVNGILSATLSGTFDPSNSDTGATGSANLTVTPVPEPATLGLLGVGLLGLGLIGLSHRKRSEA